jgi:DNA-binding SARP family transcriptional activator
LGQLIVTHTTLHLATTPLAIAIFLGLAIYVITSHPHRPLSWVFSLLCLTVASIYLNDLFMTSRQGLGFSMGHFLMHWKWAAIVVGSALYLHLVFFYFPPAWQRYRLWTLLPAYLLSAGIAGLALLNDFFVADYLYRPASYLINHMPGPFLGIYTSFVVLITAGSTIGLLVSYYSHYSPSLRQQVIYLLIITALVFLESVIHWLPTLTKTSDQIPHLISDMLLIIMAILYTQAVIRYGSFVGHPLARRNLFYSTLATIIGLLALYLTLSLDQWLIGYTSWPYYLATGLLVLILATNFQAFSQGLTKRLDGWFFADERRQQELAHQLAKTLVEAPTSTQLQAELLDTLRTILDTPDGYIALSTPGTSLNQLTVQTVQGHLSLQPGDLIYKPPLHSQEPQLIAAFLPQLQAKPGWQNMALFCPLGFDPQAAGILVLGEKRNEVSFSPQDLTLCAELVKQLNTFGQVIPLRLQRNAYIEAARRQKQTLRHLGDTITTPPDQILNVGEPQTAPIEIRVLGSLQVVKNGQLIPEAAWGSEKAKGLLAYLLWKSPAGVTREELSHLLWPNRTTEETANVFHVTLHRLRRVLQISPNHAQELSYIQHDRGRYRFNTAASYWLDLAAFEALLSREEAVSLQAAVNLYRGAYLEDMAWALPVEVEAKRRQLEQLCANALRHLAAQANDRDSLLYLERLLALEPADELAHQALVLGYLARGRGDLARRQAKRWQQALIEFDLEPSTETRDIWAMVEVKNGS